MTYSSISKNRGFTLIQAAITLPLMLMLIVCLIDICIYFVGQGLLDSAASQTAAEISVIPELDDPTQTSRDSAIAALRSSVLDFGQDTLIKPASSDSMLSFYVPSSGEVPANSNLAPFPEANNSSSFVHINFPFDYSNAQSQTNSNPSYIRNSFVDQPIEILVHGEARTLFLGHFIGNGGSIPITGRAIAYRQHKEPPRAAPINPCGSSSNPTSGPCACSGIMERDSRTDLCMCPGDYIDVAGSCVCPGSSTDPDPSDDNYVCVEPTCTDGTVLNEITMLCEAPTCPGSNMTYDTDGRCICNLDSCNSGNQYQDLTTCQCVDCPVGTFRSQISNVCHSCDSAEDFDSLTCEDGEFKNPDTCACEVCQTPSNSGGEFYFRQDETSNSCVCDHQSKLDADEARSDSQWFDFGTCSIQNCSQERVANSDGTSCECPPVSIGVAQCSLNGPEWIYNYSPRSARCSCTNCSTTGYENRTARADRRGCTCRADIVCDDGETIDSRTCACVTEDSCGAGDGDNRVVQADGRCRCNNQADSATCANNQRWNTVNCECQDCTDDRVPSLNGFSCVNCGSIGRIANSDNTECVCDPSISCLAGERVDPETCQCTACPAGMRPDASGTDCECAGDTSCAGFNPETCECAPCPTGTMFEQPGFEHCCVRSGFSGAQSVNICIEHYRSLGNPRRTARSICESDPALYVSFNRYVCSNCDPSSQACGSINSRCLLGTEPCIINPRE